MFFLYAGAMAIMSVYISRQYRETEDSKLSLAYLIFPLLRGCLDLFHLATSIVAGFFLAKTMPLPEAFFYVFVANALLALLFIDLKCMRLPNVIVAGSSFFVILMNTVFGIGDISFYGALLGFGMSFVVAIARMGAFGGGDVKLSALLGLLAGPDIAIIILFGFVLAGVFALQFLSMGLLSRKDYIPYGVFFIGAYALHFLYM